MQAALVLYLVSAKHGRDKAGHNFLVDACRMGQELGLFTIQTPLNKEEDLAEDKLSRLRTVTAWGLFNFQLYETLDELRRVY